MPSCLITLASISIAIMLSGCGDPCERLQADLDELKRETLSNPLKLADPEHRTKLSDVLDDLNKHECGA